jgi:hypothetical protein
MSAGTIHAPCSPPTEPEWSPPPASFVRLRARTVVRRGHLLLPIYERNRMSHQRTIECDCRAAALSRSLHSEVTRQKHPLLNIVMSLISLMFDHTLHASSCREIAATLRTFDVCYRRPYIRRMIKSSSAAHPRSGQRHPRTAYAAQATY